MLDFDKMKAGAAALADVALKTSEDLYHKGKKQASLVALEAKLSRAQRQLGALVYALHKSGEQNPELVGRYFNAVAEVESEIEALHAQSAAQTPPTAQTVATEPQTLQATPIQMLCPTCGMEADPNAIFCPGCGAKLD